MLTNCTSAQKGKGCEKREMSGVVSRSASEHVGSCPANSVVGFCWRYRIELLVLPSMITSPSVGRSRRRYHMILINHQRYRSIHQNHPNHPNHGQPPFTTFVRPDVDVDVHTVVHRCAVSPGGDKTAVDEDTNAPVHL